MNSWRTLSVFFLLAMLALSLAPPLVAVAENQADERAQLQRLEESLRNLQRVMERTGTPEAQRVRATIENALEAVARVRARGGGFEEALRATITEMNRVRMELRVLKEQENATVVPPGLMIAVEVRLKMIEDLRRVVSYLEERGVEVDPKVASLLDEAESRALSLKEKLEAGNITVPQAAREIGEISRLIAEARAHLAKSRNEWAKLQLENAASRAVAKVAVVFGERLMMLEELPQDEIRKGLANLEEAVLYRHMLELRFRVRSEHCNITALLRELGVEPTPGYFEKTIAKLATEDPRTLKEVLAKLKSCLIEILVAVDVKNVPGVNETEVDAARRLTYRVREEVRNQFINLLKEVTAIPPRPVKANVNFKIDLSVASGKRWVSLEPTNPTVRLNLEGSSGSTILKNIAKLNVQRPTTIHVVVFTSSASGADVSISLKLVLNRVEGGDPIEISIPCAASSEGYSCYRLLLIIPGHDVPVFIPPGVYTIDLEVVWKTSGEAQTSVSLMIR
ncbi:MAG: hypothetical protein QXS13_02760 [Acidilobaceae archaeon]